MAESLKQLPLGKLFLDDQNPRLPSQLKGAAESEIISYMLMEAATLDLMTAIGQNGFFAGEPLLVVQDGERYRVAEGNRRLTALKLLKDPTLAPVKERKVEQIFNAVTYKEIVSRAFRVRYFLRKSRFTSTLDIGILLEFSHGT
ncbi:MAG: ParB N-terminal domain-containing protein [Planctomycetaceae bacterium]